MEDVKEKAQEEKDLEGDFRLSRFVTYDDDEIEISYTQDDEDEAS